MALLPGSMRWTVIEVQTDRRHFIAGLLAAGFVPKPTWADAGSPVFLSAAARTDGTYVLCGIDADLGVTFQVPLPARGHAAAAHPTKPEAVAFARRPGTFAIIVDCLTGAQKTVLTAPPRRHFYGHGVFSADGKLLYTTENDYEAGQGRIGIWDVSAGYVRIDEWHSGGVGPHDIKRLPASDMLVVANGGIDTHPESGRTKLNIATMQPNLSYIQDGTILETMQLAPALHKNSIRHLSVAPDGRVAFGMQWQGDGDARTLVGHHRLGEEVTLMTASADQIHKMHGYIGSVAHTDGGDTIVVTSPRGGTLQFYDARSAQIMGARSIPDVCGVAAIGQGVVMTSGTGELAFVTADAIGRSRTAELRWDNHLVRI